MIDLLETLWADVILVAIQWLVDVMVAVLDWFRDLLIQVVGELVSFCFSLLPGSWTSTVDFSWVDFEAAMSDVFWILPLDSVMFTIISAYGVVASIRATRWVLSVIPFVSTG